VRLLLNPLDGPSLLRVLRQPHLGVGRHILEAVRTLPAEVGLRLVDLVDPDRGEELDPFGPLLRAHDESRVVVFDTETTGLDLARDDVVELAAQTGGRLGPGAALHALLHTNRPLDESTRIHGITADMLARDGRPPAEVFAEFLRFVDGCVLVGHNVSYDVNIVRSQLARLGLSWPHVRAFDTLELTRRFFRLPRYTLSHVAEALHLPAAPTHRALDDVRTTWQLLQRLVPCLLAGRDRRQRAVAQHAHAFAPLAGRLRAWRELLERERPIFLLNWVIDDAKLREHWGAQNHGTRRVANLHELGRLFGEYDDRSLPPREALLHLVHLAALGSDVDRHVDADDRVFLLTVHQAKGLEFDAVFLAGATDREFPSYRSVQEGRMAEEHRLFYVAMTRARRQLFISYPRRDDRSRPQKPSRFLDALPTALVEDT
jgi:DNA helicase-2/ATP-dependent DNA helicase PcrA